MPASLTLSLRWALKAAIQEAVGDRPWDAATLDTLRASFTTMLETAMPLPGGGVSELAHRAALAAQLDDIFAELQHGSRH